MTNNTIARRLITLDLSWIIDTAESLPPNDGHIAMLMTPHWSRIVFETIESFPSLGFKPLPPALSKLRQSPTLKRARHATKLADSGKIHDYHLEIGEVAKFHRIHNYSSVPKLFHWLQKDLGTYAIEGHVLGSPQSIHIGLGMPPNAILDIQQFGQEAAAYASDLAEAASTALTHLEPVRQPQRVDLSSLSKILDIDFHSRRYFQKRWPFTQVEADHYTLLNIEGAVNTALEINSLFNTTHADATFRANVISAYHSLRTLSYIRWRRLKHEKSPWLSRLEFMLKSPQAKLILSSKGKRIRNSCMHYPLQSSFQGSSNISHSPMRTILQQLHPNGGLGAYEQDVASVLAMIRKLMADSNP